MIQQLSLTSFFTNYKPNQTMQLNPFLVETATCEFTIAALQHNSRFASMTLPYYMYFIKYALEFGKVRSKTVRNDIQRQAEHISSSSAIISSSLILAFRSNYEAYCHSFSTRTIDLHVDAARIFGCCMSSLVTLVVPVDLHIMSVRSSECMHVMSCIHVG
jgi:hypothetical protein